MGEFNSDDLYIYYSGQESLEEMEQPSQSTREYKLQYLGAISKMTERSVCFQSKPFNITVIESPPQPLKLKKLNLNGSMMTYKTFYN